MEPNIEEDFERFSKQHSWYKHLPTITTESFYIVPRKGQQPRNGIHPDVNDTEGWHWRFYTKHSIEKTPIDPKLKELVLTYPVECNAFLRGVETKYDGKPHITNTPCHLKSDATIEWMNTRHPDLIKLTREDLSMWFKKDSPDFFELFRREHNKSKEQAIQAAEKIWSSILENNIPLI